MQIISRKTVVDRILAYLNGEVDLAALVDWAENAMMAATFAHDDERLVRDVVERLGLADAPDFHLTWEDYDGFLGSLGYQARVTAVPRAS